MPRMSTTRSARLVALAALTALSTGAGLLGAPAVTAIPAAEGAAARTAAAPVPGTARAAAPILLDGRAAWGFKASWYGYVSGLGGTVTVADGAVLGAGGVVSYPVRHGSVDGPGRDADVRFGGSVTYAVPGHGITGITLANPRVVLKDGTGTLYADIRTELGGPPTAETAVPFATLKAAPGALSGNRLDWRGITAALTARGAEVFTYQGAPMYPAGTALDTLAVSGTVSVPTLTVGQVTGLGAETEVTVTGSGYRPGRGVYLAQSVALPGTTYPSVYGNAVWVRQVGTDGTFTVTMKLTETFTPSAGAAVDCRSTACFVTTFNSHDRADATWMESRAQDVARPLHFGAVRITGQPVSRTVRSGATAEFTAAADGADSVRWERSGDGGTTWAPVAGAGSPRLAVKASAALGGRYRAVFTNAAGSAATEAATLTVTAVPTLLTRFRAAPDPVAKGDRVTVEGSLWRGSATGDDHARFAGAGVTVEFRAAGRTDWTRAATATTAANGRFSVGVTAVQDGAWRARYAGSADIAPVTGAADAVDVRLGTSITGFDAGPEPVVKGRSITVKGVLNSRDGALRPAPGRTVTIWFRADGTGTMWAPVAQVRTGGRGEFSKALTAVKDGTWKATHAPTSDLMYTTTAGDRVDVR
jgi:hypothetical protein